MKSKLLLGAGGALLALLLILALTLATVGIVSAQTPTSSPSTNTAPVAPAAGSPVHLNGKVTTVSATSVVLATRRGNITANIGVNTYIVVKKNGAPATGVATDLVVGENANVVGQATADATVVDAKLITQGGALGGKLAPRAQGRGQNNPNANDRRGAELLQHAAAGTITAINGDVVTLRGVKVAVVNVNTNANSLVLNNGFSTVSSLHVGDKVEVLGQPVRPVPGVATQPRASRDINAWAIRVDNGTTRMEVAHVGTINGNTVTTNLRRTGSVKTINFDSNTRFKALTVSLSPSANSFSFVDASQAVVQVNSNILVEGTVSADGISLTAQSVIILPSRGPFTP
ncbi:MAG: hypothetical protein ABJA50_01050 [Chloroflexota bacterium]